MLDVPSRYRDFGLLVLRVGIGIMFILHGWPKLAGGAVKWEALGGAMSHLGITFYPIAWGLAAALAETLGGLCLALGVFHRIACLLLAITMLVATVMHLGQGDSLMRASHAIESGILFASLILIGPGKYTLGRGQ